MRKLIIGTVIGCAAVLSLGATATSAAPTEEVNFAVRCAKGGGVVSAGHGHDYPYLQCNGGTYSGERHYLK